MIDGAVNGVGVGWCDGPGPCSGASRPDTCATTCSASSLGTVAGPRLHADPPVVGVMVNGPFPFLTVLVLLPAAGASRWRRCRAGGCPLVPPGRRRRRLGRHARGRGRGRGRVQGRRPRLPVGLLARLGADLGIRWSLGMDGISLFLVLLTGVLFRSDHARGSRPRATRGPSSPGSSCSKPPAWGASWPSIWSCSSCSSS